MQQAQSRNKFIKQFIVPIKDELDKLKIEYEIKGRPKSIHSIWNKMRKQNIPFEEVFDLFAIRIILDTPIEQEKALVLAGIFDCYRSLHAKS